MAVVAGLTVVMRAILLERSGTYSRYQVDGVKIRFSLCVF